MVERDEYDYAAPRTPQGSLYALEGADGRTYAWHGALTTRLGVIDVYCTVARDGSEVWTFSTVVCGREYTLRERRSASRTLSERGAKIVAHRWIRQLLRRLRAGA